MMSREKKGMKRDIPDTAIIPVVQSFLVSEKIKSAGLAVMSNLVILVQTELTEGLLEVMVKTSWAGQLVVQGMVCPACIEHVDNSILPFIGRVIAKGLIFLGGRGDKILPATFDAVRRGINNDFVRHRITCYVSQQRLNAGVTRQQHNADKCFGLMEDFLLFFKSGIERVVVTCQTTQLGTSVQIMSKK